MKIDSIIGAKFGTLSTNRTTSTNPFEKTSFQGRAFKGSALPFADVFQAIKPPQAQEVKPNKMVMVAGAVAGAIANLKTNITQPVKLFAQKVKANFAHGIEVVKNAKNSVVEWHKNLHERIVNAFDWHKVEEPVSGEAKILSLKHINEKAPVKDLKATWIAENAKISSEEGMVA